MIRNIRNSSGGSNFIYMKLSGLKLVSKTPHKIMIKKIENPIKPIKPSKILSSSIVIELLTI